VDAKIFLIGRDEENDVVVPHITVSRFHAQIFRNEIGECFLSDLSTPYGTCVNGLRIKRDVKLKPHDKVVIGDQQVLNWIEPILGIKHTDLKSSPEMSKSQNIFNWVIFFVLLFLFSITGFYLYSIGIFNSII
jgi:pSer/pThr/pTyr-binding forkhead associated (FHA) protein